MMIYSGGCPNFFLITQEIVNEFFMKFSGRAECHSGKNRLIQMIQMVVWFTTMPWANLRCPIASSKSM